MSDDPYNLQRFVDAQDAPSWRGSMSIYEVACEELRNGLKEEHWMWFIFPQIAGLGRSAMAQRYAISSLKEAAAYLEHPVLGPRLRECTRLMLEVQGRAAGEILGFIDEMKFRSSMTLFANATTDNQIFLDALQKYFHGQQDEATLARI